jgi:DNA repair exonuclease SbcCD ATPase subunit/DNA repair exonuclease SbcCD nuclease subunit
MSKTSDDVTTIRALCGRKFRFIWHFADVHIRLATRHDEYRSCFDWIIRRLHRDYENGHELDTLVVIAGDILHSKCELTPEAVALVKYLFRNIPFIKIVIPGNHDANLSNSARLDALSPILDDIPDTHYLSTSGLYRAGNIVFGVNSVLDKIVVSLPKQRIDGCYYIALYHGLVNGSKNDVGTRLNGELTVDDFNGWDYGLFGDNHTCQMLRAGIAYPGSLIQQNFGESGFHGMLHWRLGSNTVGRLAVPNSWGYHRLEIIDGAIVGGETELSEHPRIQLIVRSGTPAQLASIESRLRKRYSVESIETVTERQENESDMQVLRALSTSSFLPSTMLNKYLGRRHVPRDQIDRLVEVHRRWRKEISEGDNETGTGRWVPVRMTFQNLFSYRGTWEIEFPQSVIGLFGPNDSGKSSIIDILVLTLFDRTVRGDKNKYSKIVTHGERSFRSLLELQHAGRTYMIYREGKLTSRGLGVTTRFWRVRSSSAIDNLTGKDRNETNRVIESIIGTFEEALTIGIVLQGSGTGFVDETAAKRKERINRILNLDKFDRLAERIAEKKRAANAELKVLGNLTSADQIFDLNEEHERVQARAKRLTEKQSKWRRDMESYSKLQHLNIGSEGAESELAAARRRIGKLRSQLSDLPEGEGSVSHLRELRAELDITLGLQQTISQYTDEHREALNCRDVAESMRIAKRYGGGSNLLIQHVRCEHAAGKIDGVEVELQHSREAIEQLKRHKYDPNCRFCTSNSFVRDAEQSRRRLPEIESTYNSLQSAIKDRERIANDAENYRSLFANMQSSSHREAWERRRCAIDAESKLVERGWSRGIESLRRQIENQECLIETVDIRNRLQRELAELENRSKLLKVYIDAGVEEHVKRGRDIEQELLRVTQSVGVLGEKLSSARASAEKSESIAERIGDLTIYGDAVSRDGIPKQLAAKLLPQLESEINTIIHQVADFHVSIDPVTASISVHKTIDGRDVATDAQLACGSNKLLIELALRSVIATMTCGRAPNILVLDEAMYSLDGERMGFIESLFNTISKHFHTMLLITHSPVLKGSVHRQISPKPLRSFNWKERMESVPGGAP